MMPPPVSSRSPWSHVAVELGGDQIDDSTQLKKLGVLEQFLILRQELEVILKVRVGRGGRSTRSGSVNLHKRDRVRRDRSGGIGRGSWARILAIA